MPLDLKKMKTREFFESNSIQITFIDIKMQFRFAQFIGSYLFIS